MDDSITIVHVLPVLLVFIYDPMGFQDIGDLLMDVVPLPHADKREKMGLAEFSHFVLGSERLKGTMIMVPDIEQSDEVRT